MRGKSRMLAHSGFLWLSNIFDTNYFKLLFAVLMEAIKILLSSRQSLSIDSPISLEIYSEARRSLSQYSVSAASFSAICNFEIKSALL